MKSYLLWFHMKSIRFYWNLQNFTVFLLDQQDFTWNPADYTKTSGFHSIQQDFTETNRISWNLADFMKCNRISHEIHQISQNLGDFMMVQQDFTKYSGFHEIQQYVTETNRISCEIHKWNLATCYWNPQNFTVFLLNQKDFTWNPADYTKTSGFHDIQQVSLKSIGCYMKSTWFHEI